MMLRAIIIAMTLSIVGLQYGAGAIIAAEPIF